MPSFSHEAPLTLIRERPEIVVALLDLVGVAVPSFAEAIVDTPVHTDVAPVERRADLVVTLRAQAQGGAAGRALLGVIIEAQLRPDDDKRFAWPHYTAGLHERLRAPACLVVLAADERTAAWARQPISTFQPGSPFVPLVVAPSRLPRIRSEAEARRAPELAVLSAMAHGNGPSGLDVVRAAIGALADLDRDRKLLYFDMILRTLNDATRVALERLMQTNGYEWSDWAKEQQAIGRSMGRAESLLAILAARGLPVSDELRGRILAIGDLATYDRLIRRAATATAIADVFAAD